VDPRGDAALSTWLLHIATNQCLDLLRQRGRWRVEAQPMAKNDCFAGESSLHGELMATLRDPGFAFDAREHIAFCFTCVARTLDAETQVALVLSDLFDVDNREAAAILGLNESAYRHRLADGRARMQAAFEGLCALVSKTGTCYQCSELRDLTPEERRGPEVPSLGGPDERWHRRLTLAKEADLEEGRSRALHDLLFKWIDTHGRAVGDRA
jgi:RNA polymerase sigma-70 factor (ECF subfamily)